MPPGTMHWVLGLGDTIAEGGHLICTSNSQAAVQITIHHVITRGCSTNSSFSAYAWMLLRVFMFVAREIIARLADKGALSLAYACMASDRPLDRSHVASVHDVDPTKAEGMADLLALQTYALLYPALFLVYPSKVSKHQYGHPSTMEPRFVPEVETAWKISADLWNALDDAQLTPHAPGANETPVKLFSKLAKVRAEALNILDLKLTCAVCRFPSFHALYRKQLYIPVLASSSTSKHGTRSATRTQERTQ